MTQHVSTKKAIGATLTARALLLGGPGRQNDW